jgi:hypothetical protein
MAVPVPDPARHFLHEGADDSEVPSTLRYQTTFWPARRWFGSGMGISSPATSGGKY